MPETSSMDIEWNFVKSKNTKDTNEYWLVYRRISKTVGKAGSVAIPVGEAGIASVSLGASVAKSKSVMISEKLVTKTLTYLLTVFNGLKRQDERDTQKRHGAASEWEQYLSTHGAQAWAAMRLLKQGADGARGEVEEKPKEAWTRTPRQQSAMTDGKRPEANSWSTSQLKGRLTGNF
jgi:hypothetical protein